MNVVEKFAAVPQSHCFVTCSHSSAFRKLQQSFCFRRAPMSGSKKNCPRDKETVIMTVEK